MKKHIRRRKLEERVQAEAPKPKPTRKKRETKKKPTKQNGGVMYEKGDGIDGNDNTE